MSEELGITNGEDGVSDQDAKKADRARRAYTVVLDVEEMPLRVVDAILDLGDILEDFETLGKSFKDKTDFDLDRFRKFLNQHAITLAHTLGVFSEAIYLYSEIEIQRVKKGVEAGKDVTDV